MITFNDLSAISPYVSAKAAVFAAPLNAAMLEFDINTRLRQAAFLANVMQESGSLRYTRELASGEAYDTGRLAKVLGNTPEADGDGQRYKGRGLIQVTGLGNYLLCGKALGLALDAHPELLEQPEAASRSAAWFWKFHGCNELADQSLFLKTCTRVNGTGKNGLPNGWPERQNFYALALRALPAA